MPSTNFEDLILRDIAASRPAAGIPGRLFFDTTNSKFQRDTGAAWEDCEGAGGAGDMTWAAILASQLVNEIKGWPPCVNTGDLDALNLWWDKQGTPTTAPTVTDTSAAGLTDDYELCLKVVTDAASEGLYQRFTYADEPRIKAGRTCSALVAIWSVGAINITAKLVNSDASETAAAAVSAAAWTIVEVPAHVLAGTYVDLQITAGAAGTFYVVPLGLCIGARGIPLGPRPLRHVDGGTTVINDVDPGGAGFTDADCTAASSNLACMLQIGGIYSANAVSRLDVRRNGDTTTGIWQGLCYAENDLAKYTIGCKTIPCDDGQVIEYTTGAAGGTTEHVWLNVFGWWEWA